MGSARGDALEWALALARAPRERDALRQRPLPDGIEALLQIAAGSRGEALQLALARSGEPEAELVEAVRFYLREVLFHSGADAYRMLGLSADASAEQIRTHHRLLQQWLHPDRQTSDWDAIFAGRVNAAWNALRTAERRAEYDAMHPVVASTAATADWIAPHLVADVPLESEDPAARWRRRAPVLALFVACGVLGVAAVRDALREPESAYGLDAQAAAADSGQDPEAIALRLPARPAKESETPVPPTPRNTATATRRTAVAATRQVQRAEPAPPPAPHAQDVPRSVPAAPTAAMAMTTRPVEVAVDRASPRVTITRAVANAPASATAQAPEPAPVRSHPPAAMVAVAAAVPADVPMPPAAVPVERVMQAQRTGRQLLAFLSARSGRVPPIWDSLAAQQRAIRLRDSLHASGDTRGGDPQWRVDREDAALRAPFGDDAQVRAQLVWREQRWLVSGVALEQQP